MQVSLTNLSHGSIAVPVSILGGANQSILLSGPLPVVDNSTSSQTVRCAIFRYIAHEAIFVVSISISTNFFTI